MANCFGCHYIMRGQASPRPGEEWCGFMGGAPEPGNPDRCQFRPFQKSELPEGLAIAKSGRVVGVQDLAAENENFADATGRLD